MITLVKDQNGSFMPVDCILMEFLGGWSSHKGDLALHGDFYPGNLCFNGTEGWWFINVETFTAKSMLFEQAAHRAKLQLQDIHHNFVTHTHTHSSFTHNFTSHNFHTTLSCTALENNRFSTISFAFPGFSTAVTAIGKLVRLVDDDLVAKFQRFRLGFYGHFQVRKSC